MGGGVDDQNRCDRTVHVLFEAGKQRACAMSIARQYFNLRSSDREQDGFEYRAHKRNNEHDADGCNEQQHDISEAKSGAHSLPSMRNYLSSATIQNGLFRAACISTQDLRGNYEFDVPPDGQCLQLSS